MIKKLFLLALAAFAVAMAVPSTRAQIQENAVTPIMDRIRTSAVPRQLDAMTRQLNVRLGRGQGMPGNFEGWLRRDYTGPEFDPWGNSWFLRMSRRSYTVGTMGPDGQQGTDDDITLSGELPRR